MYFAPGKKPEHHPPASGGVAVAACVVDLDGHVPSEIQLTPAGHFRARDGRPHEIPAGWYIDADIASRVIATAQATAGDFVIDYEHQTLHTSENGQPAPAGGWWSGANMAWREGEGLFATDIGWTEAAKAAVAAREYRYISPVIAYDKQRGHVLAILMAALTNFPAIEGLSDLTAMAAARFDFKPDPSQQEEDTVDLKQLIELLGLAKDASEEQVRQAIADLKTNAETATALRAELGAEEGTDILAAVAALKTSADKEQEPDPAKYVPVSVVESLKTEVAELRNGITAGEVDELVQKGLDEGKLHPDQEDWARQYGQADIAGLKAYLEKTPAIAALKGSQTKGKGPQGDGQAALSGDAAGIAAMFGNSEEDLEKYGS